MRRQVSFSDEPEAYRLTLIGSDETVFEISKSTLTFSSNDFYEVFFKGVYEKPDYELMKPAEDLRGQAKHVFDTVAMIFKKTCDSIDGAWFVAAENQVSDDIDALDDSADDMSSAPAAGDYDEDIPF